MSDTDRDSNRAVRNRYNAEWECPAEENASA